MPAVPDFDGDSFDDIFSAHVLELGSNTEQEIDAVVINEDSHSEVLQSLHGWPKHVSKAGHGIPWVVD